MKETGFATSAILYTMLLLFLVLLVGILNNLQNKKIILDTLKSETKEQLEGNIQNEEVKVYGVRREINSSSTKWERIEDAEGLEANAIKSQSDLEKGVKNDFDNIYPWSDIKTYNYNTTTKKTTWIDETEFKFDGSNGEVLTYIPTFYYKKYRDSEYEYIMISNKNLEGYTKSKSFSISRYTMSLGDDNQIHSRSGKEPRGNINITISRTAAKSLGEEFSQLDYHYFIIQLLYLVEYADYNSQAILGKGNTNNTNPITSGGCDTLKMKSGTLVDDGKNSMIYRGIEDIYGNIWQYMDGINIKDYHAYVCYDSSKYVSDKFDDCYQSIEYSYADVSTATSLFIKKLGYDEKNPLISIPIEIGGSNSTYIPDSFGGVIENGKNISIVRVGGRYDNVYGGLWSIDVGGLSTSTYPYTASRLIKYK